jgi:hypothetical protein
MGDFLRRFDLGHIRQLAQAKRCEALDCRIDHLRQSKPVDKFVYEKSSPITDKRFILLKYDFDSLGRINSFDLLHLHPPGDKVEDILHYEETFVHG